MEIHDAGSDVNGGKGCFSFLFFLVGLHDVTPVRRIDTQRDGCEVRTQSGDLTLSDRVTVCVSVRSCVQSWGNSMKHLVW